MKQFTDFTVAEVQSYLSKGWLTHDAMWLYNAYRSIGIEKGNKLNRAAVKSMAPLEMERTREMLGCEGTPASIDELDRYLKTAFALLMPPGFYDYFSISIAGPSTLQWRWEKEQCFAYKGMKKTGMLEHYLCGVMYRIECWLKVLEVWDDTHPVIGGCLMKEDGHCTGTFTVRFT